MAQNDFSDHFSDVAAGYARFRPRYPKELFDYLTSVTPGRGTAWDVGTGSGQAACALAGTFRKVIATDASAEQLRAARSHDRVEYRVGSAENSSIEDGSIDLVAVAQAAHWFDLDRFYAEVRRVSKARGVVALWCYGLATVDPAVDAGVHHLARDVLGRHWPPERRFVDTRYQTLKFPFEELTPPRLSMRATWTLEQLTGYIETWSALRIYRAEEGTDPLPDVLPALADAWGAADGTRKVRWDLDMRVGWAGGG